MLWEALLMILVSSPRKTSAVHDSIQQGDNQTLSNYLRAFGYLNASEDDDENLLKSALRSFQKTYHQNATGELDSDTLYLINSPRCGVPDNLGQDLVDSNETRHNGSDVHGVYIGSHYTFFGPLRWPPNKHHLTYKLNPSAKNNVGNYSLMQACKEAFGLWTKVSKFTFEMVNLTMPADLLISFQRRDHGDGSPFDGPGRVLAHAYAPTDGRCHLDADEIWSLKPPRATEHDLVGVLAHEIGHLLGLGHTTIREAIMYAYIGPRITKRALHSDDIAGIQALYSQP